MNQTVAHTTNGLDPARFSRIVAQFSAQIGDMNLNSPFVSIANIGADVVFLTAEPAHQVRLGAHLLAAVHECVKEVEFGASQLQFGAIHFRCTVAAV